MALQINTNISALNAARNLSRSGVDLARSLERLSTGLRINSARDDAAGLAISQRFTTQIRGLNQAVRNANDGVSMLQVADAALDSVSNALQRIRELAVQAANGSNTDVDREALQWEVSQLRDEVDRIGRQSKFNGETVFGRNQSSVLGDSDQLAVIDGLKSGWLARSEALISEYFGITADGADFDIELTSFSDGASGVAARVVGSVPGSYSGKATNVRLQIDMADFTPPNLPNGGSAPFYNDRIIAHEMVHAVMYRSMNIGSFFDPTVDRIWFLEGAAEFIHGADERLAASVDSIGAAGLATIAGNFGTGGTSWGGSSDEYSAAYAAVRYLHDEINAAGGSGIADVMTYLNNNLDDDLDDAINAATNGAYASTDAFEDAFAADAANYINALESSGALANSDTGAVGGLDADGGPIRTAESVIGTGTSRSGDDQLAGFVENYEAVVASGGNTNERQFQLGANVGDTSSISFGTVGASALDLSLLDVVTSADQVIFKMDRALDYISTQRANIGAQLNRFESTIRSLQTNSESMTASRSRILDADFASETATVVRSQILQQAGIAVMAQANSQGGLVIALLS